MNNQVKIPEVRFQDREKKVFGFDIIFNRDLLINNLPKDYNPFRPHRIQFYAILFIREGEGNHYIDFKTYPYKKGSIIFISKEQVHAFEKNLKRDGHFLLFTEDFLERSSLGSNLMQQLSLYNYQLYHPVLQLNNEQFSVFSNLVARIIDEYESTDDFATEEIIQSSLKIFLCLAERIRKKRLATQNQPIYYEEFLQFQKLLKLHILKSRQVKFYAETMNMSTKKLNRITQEVISKPVKAYIHELLIIEIKRLLMNTSLSIKEVAYHSGFEDATNFVKYFKKYAGITPKVFRKQF